MVPFTRPFGPPLPVGEGSDTSRLLLENAGRLEVTGFDDGKTVRIDVLPERGVDLFEILLAVDVPDARRGAIFHLCDVWNSREQCCHGRRLDVMMRRPTHGPGKGRISQ